MSSDSLDARLNGLDLFGAQISRDVSGVVAERFGFAPFSVLDGRSGEWQDRKRAWKSIGLRSEVGRDAASIHCPTASDDSGLSDANFTSIFDPVLCECAYRWFSGPGFQVVDPFAGGSVRGIVAGMLGRKYWGCDLRSEQVAANIAQADAIAPSVCPEWVCGDSSETLAVSPRADLVFSCPPYGDLERYSDDPKDLSAMPWDEFVRVYHDIIALSVARMRMDRFACFVVGDFRDDRGNYRDFVGVTVAAFRDAGAMLYNEAVLVTSVGSASMRVSKQFGASRKLCKTHQNVLVFVKGDGKRAAAACGEVEV